MAKKPTVIVAIPAYNEEKNIFRALRFAYEQEQTNFILKDVWVYSDGSKDKTVDLVKENFKKVKVFDFKNNLGKIKRLNQILKKHNADILICMDSDIILKDKSVFGHLVSPIINYEKVGIVCSYHVANKTSAFIGSLAYFGFKIWDNARSKLGSLGIRYYSEGGLRAFSNEFTKAISLPENCPLSEDSYSFYFAMENGFKVKVAKKAKAYIDLPETYKDYSKQMKRFLTALGGVENSFDGKLIKRFQLITPKLKIRALLEEFLKDPITGFCYILLQGLVYIELPFYNPKIIWTSIERK